MDAPPKASPTAAPSAPPGPLEPADPAPPPDVTAAPPLDIAAETASELEAVSTRAASPDAAVVIEGVTKRFGDDTAVAGISLVVEPGTIVGVIGPSGAGKTTTIRLLTGALAPTDGTVRVLGEDPRRFRRQTRERIGYMPQQFTLYRDLTTRENVDFVASLFGILWRTRHRRTREVLEFVDLWDVRSRRAGDLSGGMQRRLELACALVHSPDLIFLDEPTAGIDPLLRARIWDELHRLRDAGRTLLVTTQYVGEAEACNTVALISGGRLIALAPPDELRRLAIGGDTIEIETAEPIDRTAFREAGLARTVEQLDPRRVRIVVDDAGVALPDIVEVVRRSGAEITSAQEVRPSFDAVFATLVERDRAGHDGQDEVPPAAIDEGGRDASGEAA